MQRTLRGAAAVLTALLCLARGAAAADPIDDLRHAVLAFRGIGLPDIPAYHATFRLPEEDSRQNQKVVLEELWRSPSEFAIRAADSSPTAIVRSYAIFLEPLYVARASILDTDFDAGAGHLRKVARVESKVGEGGLRTIHLTLPAKPDSALDDFLRDVSWLEGRIDATGRLQAFHVEFRSSGGRPPEKLDLSCAWKDTRAPQPSSCTWKLPDGGTVKVQTAFRDEHGRRVPASRRVTFPSRYDPGESEDIHIEYGPYGTDVPADALHAPGTFRYDANGLVSK
jgi:hypothetical protein